MSELKRQLAYIDKTNWLFEKDTVDFTSHIPFDIEETRTNKHSFTIGTASHIKK